jgi:hypothetical protein
VVYDGRRRIKEFVRGVQKVLWSEDEDIELKSDCKANQEVTSKRKS